jgi:hypothetical protein
VPTKIRLRRQMVGTAQTRLCPPYETALHPGYDNEARLDQLPANEQQERPARHLVDAVELEPGP